MDILEPEVRTERRCEPSRRHQRLSRRAFLRLYRHHLPAARRRYVFVGRGVTTDLVVMRRKAVRSVARHSPEALREYRRQRVTERGPSTTRAHDGAPDGAVLPPPVRTVLIWAAAGVAVGVMAALAVATLVAAPATSFFQAMKRVEEAAVLVAAAVPIGWAAGVAAGMVVAAGRGARGLVVLGALTTIVAASRPLLASVPIVLTLAGMSLPGRRWRRAVAGLTLGVSVGLGLLGIPAEALLTARGVPRGLGLVVGLLGGFAAAAAALSPRRL